MRGKKTLSIDVINRTTMGLVVGSCAVTNIFKSDMYSNVLNKLPHLPKVSLKVKDFEYKNHMILNL